MNKEERKELVHFEKMKEKASEFAKTYYQPEQSKVETVRLNSAINFATRFAISLLQEEEKEFPTKEVIFFKLVNGKYLAENGKEVTTEMIWKSEHSLFHDSGWLIIKT